MNASEINDKFQQYIGYASQDHNMLLSLELDDVCYIEYLVPSDTPFEVMLRAAEHVGGEIAQQLLAGRWTKFILIVDRCH